MNYGITRNGNQEGIVSTGLAVFLESDFPTLKRGADEPCASGALHSSRFGNSGGGLLRSCGCGGLGAAEGWEEEGHEEEGGGDGEHSGAQASGVG